MSSYARNALTCLLASSVALSGCGGDAPHEPSSKGRATALDQSVTAKTLGPEGRARPLLALPDQGSMFAICRKPGRVRIGYRNSGSGTTQSVAVEGSGVAISSFLNPRDGLVAKADVQGVQTWLISRLSEGIVQVTSVIVSSTEMKGRGGCFVSAQRVSERRRR